METIPKYHILVDTGHGEFTSGKESPWFVFQGDTVRFVEWWWNYLTGEEVCRILGAHGVPYTKINQNPGIRDNWLTGRVDLANEIAAHSDLETLFISIHYNAEASNYWGRASGVEAYHYPGNETGRKLAADLAQNVAEETGFLLRSKPTGGAKVHEKELTVLYKTKMTAVLLEGGFFSSRREVEQIMSGKYLDVARGIARTCLKWNGIEYKGVNGYGY